MNKHTNVFLPYLNKAATHEDHLTRAFLILIRSVPWALSAFIDLIRAQQMIRNHQNLPIIPPLSQLSGQPLEMDTQTGSISQESGTLVSILLTDSSIPITPVTLVNRNAVYDGVISFNPDWILVLENKPCSSNVWNEQLNPSTGSLPTYNAIQICPQCVVLEWCDIIQVFGELLQSPYLAPLERLLLVDFLSMVEQDFGHLYPYTKFSLMRDYPALLAKRCTSILEKIAPTDVKPRRGILGSRIVWDFGALAEIILEVKLDLKAPGTWTLLFGMYPASTIAQARQFYEPTLQISALLGLTSKGWDIFPNMNFAYPGTKHVWETARPMSLNNYIQFWLNAQNAPLNEIRQRPAGDFVPYFDSLLKAGLITQSTRAELDVYFTNTARPSVNPCPEVGMWYEWSRADAIHLDDSGKFAKDVADRINEALQAVGLTFPSHWNRNP